MMWTLLLVVVASTKRKLLYYSNYHVQFDLFCLRKKKIALENIGKCKMVDKSSHLCMYSLDLLIFSSVKTNSSLSACCVNCFKIELCRMNSTFFVHSGICGDIFVSFCIFGKRMDIFEKPLVYGI
jgi:hypothetical protein